VGLVGDRTCHGCGFCCLVGCQPCPMTMQYRMPAGCRGSAQLSFVPGGQKCMSFRATEPSPKRNLCIRNKTYKAPTTTTTRVQTPGAESQHAQIKSHLELTVPVKKIESLAKLLVICTTALFQLMVRAQDAAPRTLHPSGDKPPREVTNYLLC